MPHYKRQPKEACEFVAKAIDDLGEMRTTLDNGLRKAWPEERKFTLYLCDIFRAQLCFVRNELRTGSVEVSKQTVQAKERRSSRIAS